MKKRNFLILIIVIFLVVTASVFCILENQKPSLTDTFEAKPGTVRKIEYILVKSAFFNETKILKPNAALLITNKDEIVEDQELFLAEQAYAHSCGYDYSIQFWKDSDSLSHIVDLNSECEIFDYKPADAKKRLDFYIRKLEIAPTHYIYNLELSVMTEPEEVNSAFRNSGMKLFFIDNSSSRFPSVSFSYQLNTFVGKSASENSWEIAEKVNKEKTEKIINEIIEKVKAIASVVKQSDIFYNSYGRANDYMTHRGEVELIFKKGIDLSKVKDILTNDGAIVESINNPSSYNIQLIDTVENLENVKMKLKKYDIVKSISEYSKAISDHPE